jgi:glycosyltransferase involved in cell wall biosynthesis
MFRVAVGAGRLWLIGEGSRRHVQALRKLTKQLGVEDDIFFLGRLSASEKHRCMSQAHALLMASVREGWGLVVTEANTCGTPAIVYDVPGLRDAVRHEETGLVVRPNVGSLAEGMMKLWTDRSLHQRLSADALRWSHEFAPDQAAIRVLDYLSASLNAESIGPYASDHGLAPLPHDSEVARLPRQSVMDDP